MQHIGRSSLAPLAFPRRPVVSPASTRLPSMRRRHTWVHKHLGDVHAPRAGARSRGRGWRWRLPSGCGGGKGSRWVRRGRAAGSNRWKWWGAERRQPGDAAAREGQRSLHGRRQQLCRACMDPTVGVVVAAACRSTHHLPPLRARPGPCLKMRTSLLVDEAMSRGDDEVDATRVPASSGSGRGAGWVCGGAGEGALCSGTRRGSILTSDQRRRVMQRAPALARRAAAGTGAGRTPSRRHSPVQSPQASGRSGVLTFQAISTAYGK